MDTLRQGPEADVVVRDHAARRQAQDGLEAGASLRLEHGGEGFSAGCCVCNAASASTCMCLYLCLTACACACVCACAVSYTHLTLPTKRIV